MFGFTKQEQKVITFLLVALLLGIGVTLLKRSRLLPNDPRQADLRNRLLLEKFREEFDAMAEEQAMSDSARSAVPPSPEVSLSGTPTRSGMPGELNPKGANAGTPPPTPPVINLNSATVQQLEQLPAIGPVVARRIVEYRTKSGRFTHIDELKNVRGIGQKILERIRPYVTL